MPILVRLQPELLASLDGWIANQEIPSTRPEAIRRLLEFALAAKPKEKNLQSK
jgi:metal-responsive CopG/Arc/MetJ family transcriptional regulator